MTFTADYPAAIVYEAHHTNTLGPPCSPKGWVLHTPEEAGDDAPNTPRWFATYHSDENQRGATHYFVSYLGFVFQCVQESVAPIANGVLGKPYPVWADSNVSLNRQTLSVEVEGYAATIANTISPAQTTALLNLLAYGCDKYNIPRDRAHIIGHYQVANNRSDPGTLNIDALVAELQEEDMAWTDAEKDEVLDLVRWFGIQNPGEPFNVKNTILFSTRDLGKTVQEVVAAELLAHPAGQINYAVLVTEIVKGIKNAGIKLS